MDLVLKLKRGEPDAFDELVLTYQDRIYGLVYRYLGAGSNEADDLAQEVFIRAFTHIRQFRGDSGLGTWLYRITANVCLDFMRRLRRDCSRMLREESAAIGQHGLGDLVVADRRAGPEELAEQSELQARIQGAMQALSPRHRLVMLLHDMEGLTYEEISEVMGCNVGTVKSRLFYARQEMRRRLMTYIQDNRGEG